MRSNFHNTPELMSMIRPLRAIFMRKNINYVLTWKLRQNTDTFLTDLLPTCYELRHFIFSSWNLSETEKSKDERVRRPSDVFCDHGGGRETAGTSKLVLNIANISVRLWQQLLQFKQLSDETEFISSHTFCCIQIFIKETKVLEKKVELYSVSVYIGKISSSDKSGINLVIYSDTTALHWLFSSSKY